MLIELKSHYSYVIMGTMASQITSLTFVYSTVHSGADQRKHQSSASLASVRGFHRWPVNSLHKWPVTRKMFPYDDVIMCKMGLRVQTVGVNPNEINTTRLEQNDVHIWDELHWQLSDRWLGTRLQCLQCVSNGDTAVFHQAIDLQMV